MGFLCSLYNNTIRFLFSAFIVYLGLKGLSDANVTFKYAENSISIIETILKNVDLTPVKKFSLEIVFFQNFCLIFGGLLCLFGLRMRKLFIGLGLFLYVMLIQNPVFYPKEAKCNSLKILTFFGASLLA
jgi:hypothetical protein